MSPRKTRPSVRSSAIATKTAPPAAEPESERAATIRLVYDRTISLDPAPTDALIAAIAAQQRGRVSRQQLLSAEISPRTIDRRVPNSRLIQIHPSAHALPGTHEIPLSPPKPPPSSPTA